MNFWGDKMDFLPGSNSFLVGCNYWSSEGGIQMWRNWSFEAVEKDFIALSSQGVNVLRVFPLWPDFQPVSWACGIAGKHKELVMPSGKALPEKVLNIMVWIL